MDAVTFILLTPNALKVLDTIPLRLAHKVYFYLCGNYRYKEGITQRISRHEIMDHFGISQRTWRRVEKTLRENNLIDYHEQDTGRYKQAVHFLLPLAHDWYKNVQEPLEIHIPE